MNLPDVPFTFGMSGNHFDSGASSAGDLGQHPHTGWTDQTLLHIRQQQTMVADFEACRREIKLVSPKHPSPALTIVQDLSSGCVAVYHRPGWNLNFLSRRHYKPQAGPPAVEDTLTRSCPSP